MLLDLLLSIDEPENVLLTRSVMLVTMPIRAFLLAESLKVRPLLLPLIDKERNTSGFLAFILAKADSASLQSIRNSSNCALRSCGFEQQAPKRLAAIVDECFG